MGSKIGILLENRFIDKEIRFYSEYFPKAGYELHFLTRLWGQKELTFIGMEEQTAWVVKESFEELREEELKQYAAVIIPAGYVADYLLYEGTPKIKSPAVCFLEQIMEKLQMIKGFICHALWIAGPLKDTFSGRKVTCHNNIISHVENAGMIFQDADVYEDGDIITARTGGDYEAFANAIDKRVNSLIMTKGQK